MKKTTIIFDFDGTIADSLALVVQIANKIIRNRKGQKLFTPEVMAELRSKSAKEVLQMLKIPFWKVPFLLLKGKKLFKEEVNSLVCFPKLGSTLHQLKMKGLRLGILSSNSEDIIELFLKNNKIDDFDFIHSERNIFGKSKALKNVLKHSNLSSDEVIYVGDEVRDIEACKNAGVDVIAVTWGFNSKEVLEKSKPDYLVEKPEELLKILI